MNTWVRYQRNCAAYRGDGGRVARATRIGTKHVYQCLDWPAARRRLPQYRWYPDIAAGRHDHRYQRQLRYTNIPTR